MYWKNEQLILLVGSDDNDDVLEVWEKASLKNDEDRACLIAIWRIKMTLKGIRERVPRKIHRTCAHFGHLGEVLERRRAASQGVMV
jgi:hypothetical protein